MILEGKWLFSGTSSAAGLVGQALTGTSAINSTNVIDLGLGYNNQVIPAGLAQKSLFLVIVAQVASGGTTPTLKVDVVTATDAAFTSPQVIGSFQAGALKAGDIIVIPVPQTNLEFLKLIYTQTGTTPTNTVIASLTTDPQQWFSFADYLLTSP